MTSFPIPIPHFMNRQKDLRFTISKFEESSHLYTRHELSGRATSPKTHCKLPALPTTSAGSILTFEMAPYKKELITNRISCQPSTTPHFPDWLPGPVCCVPFAYIQFQEDLMAGRGKALSASLGKWQRQGCHIREEKKKKKKTKFESGRILRCHKRTPDDDERGWNSSRAIQYSRRMNHFDFESLCRVYWILSFKFSLH